MFKKFIFLIAIFCISFSSSAFATTVVPSPVPVLATAKVKPVENAQKTFDEYIESQQYQKALVLSNMYLQTDPNSFEMYNNRGVAYKSLGQYNLAVKDFDKAIILNKNYVPAYANKAVIKIRLKDFKGAIDIYTKIIALDPNDWKHYNSRGIARLAIGDYRGSIEDFNKAITLNRNVASLYENREVARHLLELTK